MTRSEKAKDETVEGGEWLFYGLLALLAVEFMGLAKDLPILKTIRFSTLLAYLLFVLTLVQSSDASALWKTRQAKLLVSFIVFTILSVIWAVVQTYAFNTIREFVDGTVLFVLVALLVNSQRRLSRLSWTCLLIVVVIVARNGAALADASRSVHFHAAGVFLGDGNDFAWGLVVLLPIVAYALLTSRGVALRIVALMAIVICMAGIVGSGSRGGALGLMAACSYYWAFESRRKVLTATVLLVGLAGVLLLAPTGYLTRIQTVAEYEEDSSAQARLQTWGAGMKMAIDFPLGVGAGNFPAAYGRYYIPDATSNRIAWAGGRWLNAHSIYFRALGEYGVLGLLLLLWLIGGNIRDNLRLRSYVASQRGAGKLSPSWPSLLNMSTIGFAVCGIFLGGLTYPQIFILSGLTVASRRIAALPLDSAKFISSVRGTSANRTRALPHRRGVVDGERRV